MRGTARKTNKALSQPPLFMGCERDLAVGAMIFWLWAILSVFPHWPTLLFLLGLAGTLVALRYLAKKDPSWLAVFRTNSRFLLYKRLYQARGYAWNVRKVRPVRCLPAKLTRML